MTGPHTDNQRDYIDCFSCGYDHPEDAWLVAYVGHLPNTEQRWHTNVVIWLCDECVKSAETLQVFAEAAKQYSPETAFVRRWHLSDQEILGPETTVERFMDIYWARWRQGRW